VREVPGSVARGAALHVNNDLPSCGSARTWKCSCRARPPGHWVELMILSSTDLRIPGLNLDAAIAAFLGSGTSQDSRPRRRRDKKGERSFHHRRPSRRRATSFSPAMREAKRALGHLWLEASFAAARKLIDHESSMPWTLTRLVVRAHRRTGSYFIRPNVEAVQALVQRSRSLTREITPTRRRLR